MSSRVTFIRPVSEQRICDIHVPCQRRPSALWKFDQERADSLLVKKASLIWANENLMLLSDHN